MVVTVAMNPVGPSGPAVHTGDLNSSAVNRTAAGAMVGLTHTGKLPCSWYLPEI